MQTAPMSLWAVRHWAIRNGVGRAAFLLAYRSSLSLSISRLVQALYRERLCSSRLVNLSSRGTCLILGRPASLWVPVLPRPFVRLAIRSWPACYASNRVPIRWGGAFLRELQKVLECSPVASRLEELSMDFHNSLSSLTLNRLLAMRPNVMRCALEPAYQGHHYYPFPGLRVGPSVEQVVTCSHLNADAVAIPLLEVSALTFRSAAFSSARECFAAWAGERMNFARAVIPVHPWQLEISPVVLALLSENGARISKQTVFCRPLASQRTLRVESTSYDLKLSADAALTSEHRLLFRLNCENAPAISALVTQLIRSEGGVRDLDIQADVASLSFADVRLAPHLSVIVRAPITVGKAESVVPAIELWTGREVALNILRDAKARDVYRFFGEYCRVVMKGTVRFLLEFGLAFEPHLQNSLIVFRGRKPHRLVLRDLDGTIMEQARVESLLERHGLSVAADTWDHMPAPSVGDDRLVHSLFFGHLAEVIDFLAERCGASQDELLHILAAEWKSMKGMIGPGTAIRFDSLSEHLVTGKLMLLARLERSPHMKFIRLPKRSFFPQAL